MTLDLSGFDAFLKEYYADKDIQRAWLNGTPFLDEVKKTEVEGDAYIVPVDYGGLAGASHTFSDALANAGDGTTAKFVATTVSQYQLMNIDAKTMKLSRGKRGAFASARTRQIDNGMKTLAKRISKDLWTDAGGTIGQLSVNAVSTLVTLTNKPDVYHFHIGDSIEAYDAATGGNKVGTTLIVGGTSLAAGTVTMTASAQAQSWVATNYLAHEGSYDASNPGIPSWITTSLTPAALYGVSAATRLTAIEALSGHKFTSTTRPIADQLLDAAERAIEAGGDSNSLVAWVQNRQFTQLAREIGAKTTFRDTTDARVGRRSMEVDSSGGSFKVMADPFCPLNAGYMLDMSTFELIHAGGVPHLVDDDGNIARRSASADAIEVRARAYYALVCWEPMRNAYFGLSTTGL